MLSSQIAELTNNYLQLCKSLHNKLEGGNLYDKNGKLLISEKEAEKLLETFSKLVFTRNKLATENGYNNFFEYIADWDGVDKGLLKEFLNPPTSTHFLNKFKTIAGSVEVKVGLNKNYTPNHTFNFSGSRNGIVEMVEHYYLNHRSISPSIIKRIKIVRDETAPYFSSSVDDEIAIVTVIGEETTNTFAINLCHEYSHAVFQLELLDSGISSSGVKMYEQEKVAINDEFAFQNLYFDRTGKTFYTLNMFDRFISTFFEKEVYSFPVKISDDLAVSLGQIYSKVRKKFLPGLSEKDNLTFLFDSFLVTMPCYYTNYSVLYFEKLFAD